VEKPMRVTVSIMLLLISFSTGVLLGCLEGENTPTLVPVNNDDTSNMNSEECKINYSIDPGCDDSDPACLMVRLINKDRFENPAESDCAPALRWSQELANVALAHAMDMCQRQFFDHQNPDGEMPWDRLDDAGISWTAVGENLFLSLGYAVDEAVDVAEESFMDEPECEFNHRSNILGRNFTYVGIGIYECPQDGKLYLTQDFASFEFQDLRNDPHEYCPDLYEN